MWINVKFLDCTEAIIQEHGAYDFKTADLVEDNTKVYEIKLGIVGADHAAAVGYPEGETFRFTLANGVLKDNRIPPAGHSNVLAQQNQTLPVGAVYPNGQHWDDTLYAIPAGTRKIIATVYYQLNSKEFIEFLRDANTTNNLGQVAYDLWVTYGMSPPVVLDMGEVSLYKPQDVDQNGTVDVDDLFVILGAWGKCESPPAECPADITGDGFIDVDDIFAAIGAWGPC
jgi:hypothetical protein